MGINLRIEYARRAMAQMTSQQAIALALQHQSAGRLSEAESIYRQILGADPNHADALNLLGVLYFQVGQLRVAMKMVGRAIELNPSHAQFHCNLGQVFAAAGQKEAAIASLQRALALQPEHVEAMNNLGVALQSAGRYNDSVAILRRAILLRPAAALLRFHLGNSLKLSGDVAGAIAQFQQAIALEPAFVEAHQNLGNAWMAAGRPADALPAFKRVLELGPNRPDGLLNFGIALRATGQAEPAIEALRRAIDLRREFPEAWIELGNALHQLGRFSEAAAAYRQALAQRPGSADAAYNLGTALQAANQMQEAIDAYRKATSIQPDHFKAWINLSGALIADRQLMQAIATSQRALEIRPGSYEPYLNLSNALCAAGRVDEAIDAMKAALRLRPDWLMANLAYYLCYDPRSTAVEIAAEHRRWNRVHAAPLTAGVQPHDNDRTPDRTLKVGYLSPDFREHSVAHFIQPLLANHDARGFEVSCYASVFAPDDVTAELRKFVPNWHDISNLSDERVAAMVRAHRIDILVDLAGHTSGGRLLVMARKPAPVQVTYLGYPNPTGLDAIDYRITDGFADPIETDAGLYPETLIRLPHTFACFRPMPEAPPVGPLPALANRFVTFASMNVLPKVNDQVLECWARILKAVPHSRLIMASVGLHEPAIADRFREKFNALGIESSRLEFIGLLPVEKYLELHNRIDLLLDTFPVNGHTITCHALWMGVPVVTLAGLSHFGRLGRSVLSNLGLQSLITDSLQAYMETAIQCAGDLPRLAKLREGLRHRMKNSPLTDGATFAREMEEAYRTLWRHWCATGEQGKP